MAETKHKSGMNINAVIFDYGMVLCLPPTAAEMRHMADQFGVTAGDFPQLWDRNRGLYDRGDLTPREYWSRLAADAGASMDDEQLKQICRWDVEMWSHINSAMLEWLAALQAAGIKAGLLSNMHAGMLEHARRNFTWLKLFQHTTFSVEVRLIKPDPRIYQHCLRGLGVPASETLFVDDNEANIRAAAELGIHAIRFHSVAQLRSQLQASGFGILPPV